MGYDEYSVYNLELLSSCLTEYVIYQFKSIISMDNFLCLKTIWKDSFQTKVMDIAIDSARRRR